MIVGAQLRDDLRADETSAADDGDLHGGSSFAGLQQRVALDEVDEVATRRARSHRDPAHFG
jgi:hypothetical protein